MYEFLQEFSKIIRLRISQKINSLTINAHHHIEASQFTRIANQSTGLGEYDGEYGIWRETLVANGLKNFNKHPQFVFLFIFSFFLY